MSGCLCLALALQAAAGRPGPVTAPDIVLPGDGRSFAEVIIEGGPARHPVEAAGHPVLPRVTCDGAATFAARQLLPPAVLAPATDVARVMTCAVELRGAAASLTARVQPPGPGLYVALHPAHAAVGDPEVRGDVFVISADGQREPAAGLQVAASTGTLRVEGSGFTLSLPEEKVPRVIALALVDGIRVGAAFLPVTGRVRLPVSTLRGAEVRVRVAGEWFGPVRAKRGAAAVPLEIPPGVTEAVVRATDPVGNAGETVVNLEPPERPRLAMAAPAPEVSAASSMLLAVAYAAAHGRPGPAAARLAVHAERGRVGEPEFRGGGLWAVPYAAPADIGEDHIVARVEGDEPAGEVHLRLTSVPGKPVQVEFEAPPEPLVAGTTATALVRLLDWIGLPLAGAEATVSLNGEPVAVRIEERGLRAELPVPETVPADGAVRVQVAAEEVRFERDLVVGPAPVAKATLDVLSLGRTARVRLAAFDAYGNAVQRDGFALETEGASAGELRAVDSGFETSLVADELAWRATVRVVGNGGPVAEAPVEFSPPRNAFRLDALASAGISSNGDGVTMVRGRVAAVLRRGFGSYEATLQLGLDVASHSGDSGLVHEGERRSIFRRITAVAVPVRLAGRRWLGSRIGIALGVSVVPAHVSIFLKPDFQQAQEGQEWVVGVRGDVRGFWSLGPGELFAAVELGQMHLDHSLATGDLERFGFAVGYAFRIPDLAF
jgi:hypothetical protein